LFADSLLDSSGPGAAIGIFHKGSVLYARGYGYADLEHRVRFTPQTPFPVGSVSKQFTAFAAALLASEGRLDLDADIRERLPYVPDFGREITARDLVHHTSGLRDQWTLFAMAGRGIENVMRQKYVLNLVGRQTALNFEPGAEHSYSNTGYTLLAEVVASSAKESFRGFTTRRLFEPLGMRSSFFHDDVTEIVPGRAHSYHAGPTPGQWRRVAFHYDVVGATGLVTTMEDLLKWAGNFARPRVGDTALIERISTSGRLRDGRPINYAYGLQRGTFCGHEALLHGGGDAAFRTLFAYFPAEDFSIALMRNGIGTVGASDDMYGPVYSITGLYLNGRAAPNCADDRLGVARPDAPHVMALAGHYLVEFDQRLVLESRNGALVLKAGYRPAAIARFRPDGSFDVGDRRFGYYKPVSEHGRIVRLDRYMDELGVRPPVPYVRVDASVPVGNLLELEGDYHSDELDMTYSFAERNGRLFADSLWTTAPIELAQVAVDRFDATQGNGERMGTVVFDRDVSGRITGLRAHSNRVRNVRFQKLH
jgi:CubicO group peptidase (beta-lactamase class C family)